MKRNMSIALVGLALSLSGVAHGVTNNAVTNGLLNAVDTWGVGSMPGAPDGNVWNANGFSLGVGSTNNTTETFYGSELVLPAGSELNGGVGWVLTLQAVTFDGGRLIKNNNRADVYDFSGQPITITANGATFSTFNRNHNMSLKNGNLMGSGDLVYSRIGGGTDLAGNSKLIFEDSVVMSNYTGTIIVSNIVGAVTESLLYIEGETAGSFGIEVTQGARLVMGGTNTYASLVLGGETLPDGDYTSMAKFTVEQQEFLLSEGGIIIVGAGGFVEDKGTAKVAVQSGNMNDGTTWSGGVAPVAGDTNQWVSAGFDIGFSNQTFEGETLIISSDDQFAPDVAGADPTVRNLTLDGGLLFNTKNTPCEIDLSGSNLTITAKGGEFRSNSTGRNILIKNGLLTGEGDLAIKYNSGSGQGNFYFAADTVLTNFTGMVNVGVNNTNGIAVVAFDGLTDGSFGVDFGESTQLDLRTEMSSYFDSVTFGTNSLAFGSYTVEQLQALGYADYILGDAGTVVVVDNRPNPELWPAELFIDSAAGNITISTTNLNPDVRVTNTLQAADSLTIVSWDDISTVVGVSETNWVITASNNAAFYQIKSAY